MSTLTINLNEEYRIKIEKGNDFHNSIFKDIYIDAARNVVEIINQSDTSSVYDDFNNIIAFTGERGKGKSSSMISFRDALVNNNDKNHKDFFNAINLKDKSLKSFFEILRIKKFAEIDIIDPSLFKGNESLIEIILAKMFSRFQDKIKDQKSTISDDVRRCLISRFQKVFENLQIINLDRKELYKLETIEALSKLATGSNLRDCFKELVAEYLKTFEEKEFLVIAIDDFDLNISEAYPMLEDIRQFLIQNKLIILIGCKVEQLNDALELHFNDLKLKNEIENKSYRYLDKLIPFSRRISLPNVDSISNIHLRIEDNNKLLFDSLKSNLALSISEVLYKNFNIFLSNNQFRKNSFIPKTIRETQYLFKVLNEKENYSLLQQYLVDEITKKNIFVKEFQELENCSDLTFNIFFIRKIYSVIENDFFKEANINQRYKYEAFKLSNSKLPDSISFGDVFYLIDQLEKFSKIDDWKINEFLDYVKLYYILRMYKINPNLKKLNFIKLGFYNGEQKIVSEEKGLNNRVFVEFKNQIDITKLNNSERVVISMFTYLLGDSKNYRNDFEKDKLMIGYKKGGIITPFSIFNNINNINILSQIFEYDKTNQIIIKAKKWDKESELVLQLCNPYFTLELFSELIKFRTREIKQQLPEDSYFDIVCLLFIYGMIDSLKKLEEKYSYIKPLSFEFSNNPIILLLVRKFISNPNNLKFRKVNEINEIYFNNLQDENEVQELEITNNLCTVLNNIFIDSREEELIRKEQLNPELNRIVKNLYNKINNKNNYTARTVNPFIKELEKIDATSNLVSDIIEFRNGLKNNFSNSHQKLKDYLKNIINGQSS